MVKNRTQSEKRGVKGTFSTYKKGRKYATILQVKVNSSSATQLLSEISSEIDDGNKFLVVTPNPEIIMLAHDEDTVLFRSSTSSRTRNKLSLYGILNSAEFSLPDGVGLVWVSIFRALRKWVLPQSFPQENPQGRARRAFLGAPLTVSPTSGAIHERVSGVDMMQSLVEVASERGWRVFLLGGKPGVAEAAANHLTRQYPNILVHWDSGPWLNDDGVPKDAAQAKKEAEVVRKINQFKPNLLFVGFGAPKQEKWIARNLKNLDVNCAMVVGGAFDYISGRVPRAPQWMQNLGLEWLFRLIIEPWRIKREFALFKFGWLVLTGK